MTDVWSSRAEGYRAAVEQREGEDLDLIVAWCGGAKTALDVATGGGHVAPLRGPGAWRRDHVRPGAGDAPGRHLPRRGSAVRAGQLRRRRDRIAPHHFEDVPAALAAMARASRDLVIVEDTLYASDRVEEAERLRDPTHIRSYTEAEWRSFLLDAGLVLEEVRHIEKTHPFDAWLARTGCEGEEAERVRALLSERTTPDGYG